MKSGMNAVLLIVGGLFFQWAIAQTEPVLAQEHKADVPAGNIAPINGAKESAGENRAVRSPPLATPAPERSVEPGKNNTISLPQIPVDQLGLGCAE